MADSHNDTPPTGKPMLVIFDGYNCQQCGCELVPVAWPEDAERIAAKLESQRALGRLRCTECGPA